MRLRRTSRLILLDPAERLLLFEFEDDLVARLGEPLPSRYWITPGGALEPGEDHETAAPRERREETGIAGAAIGPRVALCEPILNWDRETDPRPRPLLPRAHRGTGRGILPAGMDERGLAVHRQHR